MCLNTANNRSPSATARRLTMGKSEHFSTQRDASQDAREPAASVAPAPSPSRASSEPSNAAAAPRATSQSSTSKPNGPSRKRKRPFVL